MTIASAAAANRRALIAQLYDRWQGYYVVVDATSAAPDGRRLSRSEAESYRCKAGEALEVVWKQIETA